MNPEIERFRELRALIRAGHAELGILQLQLVEAHERKFNSAQLGVRIADIGREIAAWKLEQKALFRRIASDGASELESSLACSYILDRLNAQQGQSLRVKQSEKCVVASDGFTKRKQVSA